MRQPFSRLGLLLVACAACVEPSEFDETDFAAGAATGWQCIADIPVSHDGTILLEADQAANWAEYVKQNPGAATDFEVAGKSVVRRTGESYAAEGGTRALAMNRLRAQVEALQTEIKTLNGFRVVKAIEATFRLPPR